VRCGLGFAGKIGKEDIVGLYVAVKRLVEDGEAELHGRYRRQMDYIASHLGDVPFVGWHDMSMVRGAMLDAGV